MSARAPGLAIPLACLIVVGHTATRLFHPRPRREVGAAVDTAPALPLQRGLTLSYVSSLTGEPDYEGLIMVERADTDAIGLRISWNRGTDRRWKVYRRPVSRRERQRGHSFYVYADEADTATRRGYAFSMATSAVMADLVRDGKSDVAVLLPEVSRTTPYRGTLTRVGQGAERFSVLVDGERVSLPAVRVRGVLSNPVGAIPRVDAEYVLLDDPQSPWFLYSHVEAPDGRGGTKVLVRVSTGRSESRLARELGEACEAQVNDIYFATGSADVDSASTPAFEGIAAVLSEHPDWLLTIVGHTDSIGSAPDNEALSERRAAAVLEVLQRDYHIAPSRLASEGHGETEPLEDNGTQAGRARNRRVDLKRKCNAPDR